MFFLTCLYIVCYIAPLMSGKWLQCFSFFHYEIVLKWTKFHGQLVLDIYFSFFRKLLKFVLSDEWDEKFEANICRHLEYQILILHLLLFWPIQVTFFTALQRLYWMPSLLSLDFWTNVCIRPQVEDLHFPNLVGRPWSISRRSFVFK